MNFIDEFAKKLGFDDGVAKGGFKVFCYNFDNVVVEGHKGIMLFSQQEMRFKVKGGALSVVGESLGLKNFTKFSACVCGDVVRVEFIAISKRRQKEVGST